MALPALRAVRARFPEAEITILARPYVASIYRNQGVCDNTMFVENKRDIVGELRAQKFDVGLLLQNAFEAAWIAWRAGIPQRVGYARDGRGPLLNTAVSVPKDGEIPRHESHYYLELIRRVGWIETRGEVPPIQLHVTSTAKTEAEAALLQAGARPGAWRCAIAPGASYGAAK